MMLSQVDLMPQAASGPDNSPPTHSQTTSSLHESLRCWLRVNGESNSVESIGGVCVVGVSQEMEEEAEFGPVLVSEYESPSYGELHPSFSYDISAVEICQPYLLGALQFLGTASGDDSVQCHSPQSNSPFLKDQQLLIEAPSEENLPSPLSAFIAKHNIQCYDEAKRQESINTYRAKRSKRVFRQKNEPSKWPSRQKNSVNRMRVDGRFVKEKERLSRPHSSSQRTSVEKRAAKEIIKESAPMPSFSEQVASIKERFWQHSFIMVATN